MAKKKKNSKGSKTEAAPEIAGDGMYLDPAQIRFQHSKIRPVFSGCSRSVEQTLQDITSVSDLPPIQVLSYTEDQQWYFSLNNRRLWVLKRLREEGLIEKVFVRVRQPKSQAERDRYTVQNCALEAKILSESNYKGRKGKNGKRDSKKKDDSIGIEEATNSMDDLKVRDNTDDDEDSSDGIRGRAAGPSPNRFALASDDDDSDSDSDDDNESNGVASSNIFAVADDRESDSDEDD